MLDLKQLPKLINVKVCDVLIPVPREAFKINHWENGDFLSVDHEYLGTKNDITLRMSFADHEFSVLEILDLLFGNTIEGTPDMHLSNAMLMYNSVAKYPGQQYPTTGRLFIINKGDDNQ